MLLSPAYWNSNGAAYSVCVNSYTWSVYHAWYLEYAWLYKMPEANHLPFKQTLVVVKLYQYIITIILNDIIISKTQLELQWGLNYSLVNRVCRLPNKNITNGELWKVNQAPCTLGTRTDVRNIRHARFSNALIDW